MKARSAVRFGNICWFSVKDAPKDRDVFVIDTAEKITSLGLNKSSFDYYLSVLQLLQPEVLLENWQ
ncbi:hypothetical protein [Photorhabdus asymbiotica]|uniref:hypothetical protein n=1 Tax=Photorhabdus asymbiotica TaxID=291112 RepID=UPI003DA784A7